MQPHSGCNLAYICCKYVIVTGINHGTLIIIIDSPGDAFAGKIEEQYSGNYYQYHDNERVYFIRTDETTAES